MNVKVESMAVERIKLRAMLEEWSNTKSLSLASKICEMLNNNVALLS